MKASPVLASVTSVSSLNVTILVSFGLSVAVDVTVDVTVVAAVAKL